MNNLISDYEFESFSSRKSFNRNLAHFKAVNSVVASIESGENAADAVVALLQENALGVNQIPPIAYAILFEKFSYSTLSFNLTVSISDFSDFKAEFLTWKAVDLVFAYHHPESGFLFFNPKNPLHWDAVGELKKNELITVYVGAGSKFAKYADDKAFKNNVKAALEKSQALLNGSKVKIPAGLKEGAFNYKVKSVAHEKAVAKTVAAPRARKTVAAAKGHEKLVVTNLAPVQAATPVQVAPQQQVRTVATNAGRMTMSPKIPIQVTNELFHNGNVEAWKRIIDSYTARHTSSRVAIYYDGEVINDINSLFKWGKVKHGTSILVSVASPEEKIADLAKLRKYLMEGASPRYEFFLKGAPGKTLELF